MKKITFYLVAIAALILVSCSKDDFNNETNEIEDDNVTVLNEATTLLTDKQISYITEVKDDGIIFFDSSAPQDVIPQKGKILLYGNISNLFPTGFLGRVTKVEKENEKYKITTETVGLEEAFDRLYVNQTVDMIINEPPKQKTRSVVPECFKDENGYVGMRYKWGFNGDEIDNCEQSASITGTTSLGVKMLCFIDINKGKAPYIAFTMEMNPSLDINFKLKASLDKNTADPSHNPKELLNIELGEWPITPVALPASAAINIVCNPRIAVTLFAKASGSMEMETNIHASQEIVAGLSYKDKKFDAEINPKNNSGSEQFLSSKLTLNGKLYAGINIAARLSILNEKLIAGELGVNLGPSITANIIHENTQSSFYDANKDSKIKTSLLDISGTAKLTLLNKPDVFPPKDFLEKEFFTKEYYIMPLFENISADVDKSNNSATVKTTMKRDLLFENKIGLALYKNGEPIDYSQPCAYKNEEEFQNPLSFTFVGLDKKQDYVVCPYIMLFGNTYLASPQKRITLKEKSTTLIGRWLAIRDEGYLKENGILVDERNDDITADKMTYIFYEDGIYEFYDSNWISAGKSPERGTYTYDEASGKYTETDFDSGESSEYTVKLINEDYLILEYNDGSVYEKLTFKREY